MSETLHPIGEHVAEFKRLNTRMQTAETQLAEAAQRMAAYDSSLSFVHSRLDKREAQTDAIIRLGVSIEHMANEMTKVSTDVKETLKVLGEHGVRLNNLEDGDEGYDAQFKALHLEMKDLRIAIQDILSAPGRVALRYINMAVGAAVVAIAMYLLYVFSSGIIGK